MEFQVYSDGVLLTADVVELWDGETLMGKITPTETGIRLESEYIVNHPLLTAIEAVEPPALQVNLKPPK